MPKKNLYLMGFGTLLGFPLLGVFILYLVEENPLEFVFHWNFPLNVFYQILIGLVFGIMSGSIAWWFINRPEMVSIKKKYGVMIHGLKLNLWEIIFLSFGAGVGEEFFFRGVLQPYWGVEITAVVFVAIHGYLDPRDKKIMSYGMVMTLIIIAIGYLNIYVGLLSSMMAHFIIDVVLFYQLSNDKSLAFVPSQPDYSFGVPEIEHSETETDMD